MKFKSPFLFDGQRWFVRPYERSPTTKLLRAILDSLLLGHKPCDLLVLRAMQEREVRLLDEYLDNYCTEVLSRLIAPEEKRQTEETKARKKKRR